MTTFTYKLTNVEDGFARVVTDAGKTAGYVSREKHGSTRTGTRWVAHRLNTGSMLPLGYGDTRADAVKIITDRHAAIHNR